MFKINQLVLTYLLNACWQLVLIGAAASFAAWIIRRVSNRYKHWLWTAGLALALLVPLIAAVPVKSAAVIPAAVENTAIVPIPTDLAIGPEISLVPDKDDGIVHINPWLGLTVLFLYTFFVAWRSCKLFLAWRRTKAIVDAATPIEPDENFTRLLSRCSAAFGVAAVEIRSSSSIPAPATVGVRRPLIILPERLLHSNDQPMLISALGHEFVHIRRRDYFLNLLYEIFCLPLSFHPTTTLIKRRISQSRELCCDELVADKLLDRQLYARSLVQLAASAPLRSLVPNTTVGIADADILEVRIMSLLKRTTATVQRSRWLIIAGILMLMVPCLAAAAFAFRFDVGAFGSSTGWQEPSAREKQERETRERNQDRTVEELKEALAKENNPEVRAKLEASIKRHMVERATRERQFTELRERIENEQNPQVKAELQAKMQAMKEELANGTNEGWVRESAGLEQKARELKQRIETETNESTRAELIAQLKALEERQTTRTYSFTVTEKGSSERREQEEAARQARQAELARHAKISMDQAIQIANGQYPGKVLECSLNGEHWEAPGKLAKDGYVFYHVVILSNDAANPTNQHILVNAEDGRILKAGRERP